MSGFLHRWHRQSSQKMDSLQEGAVEKDPSESRWPMAGAALAAIGLTLLLPDAIRLGPIWVLPVLEFLLLVTMMATDQSNLSRRSSIVRRVAICLVAVLVLGSLVSTGFLIDELIAGGSITNEPGPLLAAGVSTWAGNGLAFALLYWELDGKGPADRARGLSAYPDFAFPQHTTPRLAPPHWRPRFLDYLYVSITNSIAFSPTDTMPLAPWSKLAMSFQSMISFAIVGLVIARAVNVFD